ncbi:MAG: glycosyltransferase [Saprospiraceae bacterium]|nr:glycosyltransferase [Saprospiraceae bacterium]
MLSILIPIFNTAVDALVTDLINQAKDLRDPLEIILLDDGSSDLESLNRNRMLARQPQVVFERSVVNLGRAQARNTLVGLAKGQHLLFLDDDSLIIRKDFLSKYQKAISQSSDVICGGRQYTEGPVEEDKRLHWRYGTVRESRSLSERARHPYRFFHSNNFIVRRSIIEDHPFDIDHLGYGYEDLMLARELQDQNIRIVHIENPVLHNELESNASFHSKHQEAAVNLGKFIARGGRLETPLERSYLTFRSLGWLAPFGMIGLFNSMVISKWKLGRLPLRFFDLQRLSWLHEVLKDQSVAPTRNAIKKS